MKFILKSLLLSSVLILFFGCSKDEEEPIIEENVITKIMPLGASRAEGIPPLFYSYRYDLWKDLVENDFEVDFIGTKNESRTYPMVNNKTFDGDHQSTSGFTSSQVLESLETALNQGEIPDVVLLSSPGGNDGLRGLPYSTLLANVTSMVEALQAKNPKVTIIIEKMAPGNANIMTEDLTNLLAQLTADLTALQAEKSTTESPIYLVDMADGFETSTMLVGDGIHYTPEGADFIAAKYYALLSTIL